MIFLRFLAFIAGTLILLAPPLVLADVHTRNLSGWAVLRTLLGLAVVAGIFFYVALLAPRMRSSRKRRIAGGLLLLIPAAVGLLTLCTRKEPQILWASGTLIGLAILMFIGLMVPLSADGGKRRMRKRERQEPVIG
jgi:MFS family permease